MEVQLTVTDLINAAHYAGLFQEVKKVLNGRGDVANHRISERSDFAVHYTGMLGEVAVSKALNIPLKTDVTFGGDGYVDMEYRGQSIQIKTNTFMTQPRYVIFNSLDNFVTDWAISCSIPFPSVVKIHGFVSRKKFIAKSEKINFGYGERVCIDETLLNPIERFDEAIERNL